jgi:hypothetical protein
MTSEFVYVAESAPPSAITDGHDHDIRHQSVTDISDLSAETPVITTFETLQTYPDCTEAIYAQAATSLFVLVVPPLESGTGIHKYPAVGDGTLSIDTSSSSEIVRVGRAISTVPERRWTVGTAGHIQTSPGRSLGTDEQDRSVLAEVQPVSSGGGAIYTTIKLSSIAISGSEQHRKDLLSAMLEYTAERTQAIAETAKEATGDETEDETAESVTHKLTDRQYHAGLLSVYYYAHTPEQQDLSAIIAHEHLPSGLQVQYSDEEWQAFLDRAEAAGIITDSGIDETSLEELIDTQNLRSFARRLI